MKSRLQKIILVSKYVAFILLVSFFLQCKRFSDDQMCDMSFGMLTVKMIDSVTHAKYIPQKVETYYNNQLIHSDSVEAVPGTNAYTIVDDNNLKNLPFNQNAVVYFKVYKNNVVRKETHFEVIGTKCHVEKVAGDSVVLVN